MRGFVYAVVRDGLVKIGATPRSKPWRKWPTPARAKAGGHTAMIALLRAVSLPLLCLVASTASASAECAWVLWEIQASEERRMFLFDHAFASRGECEETRKAWAKIAAQENARKGAGLQPADGIRHSYQCIPDTVDPRGPKGDGR